MRTATATLTAISLAAAVVAQTAPQYGQCGGLGWTGATTCPSGWTCTYSSTWYSQCLPGGSGGSPSTSTSNTGGGPTTTTTAPGSSGTLMSGYSFIRAVVDPNFHKYLRSEVKATAGDAILGEPGDAAQFKIENGQLEQYLPGGTFLYAHVEPKTDPSAVKLKVSWSTSPDTLGTFSWSGDTLLWSSSSISRPATNAWLVCPDASGNRDLYANLGPYAYQTPAGCADQTIHAYTGQTATA